MPTAGNKAVRCSLCTHDPIMRNRLQKKFKQEEALMWLTHSTKRSFCGVYLEIKQYYIRRQCHHRCIYICRMLDPLYKRQLFFNKQNNLNINKWPWSICQWPRSCTGREGERHCLLAIVSIAREIKSTVFNDNMMITMDVYEYCSLVCFFFVLCIFCA